MEAYTSCFFHLVASHKWKVAIQMESVPIKSELKFLDESTMCALRPNAIQSLLPLATSALGSVRARVDWNGND